MQFIQEQHDTEEDTDSAVTVENLPDLDWTEAEYETIENVEEKIHFLFEKYLTLKVKTKDERHLTREDKMEHKGLILGDVSPPKDPFQKDIYIPWASKEINPRLKQFIYMEDQLAQLFSKGYCIIKSRNHIIKEDLSMCPNRMHFGSRLENAESLRGMVLPMDWKEELIPPGIAYVLEQGYGDMILDSNNKLLYPPHYVQGKKHYAERAMCTLVDLGYTIDCDVWDPLIEIREKLKDKSILTYQEFQDNVWNYERRTYDKYCMDSKVWSIPEVCKKCKQGAQEHFCTFGVYSNGLSRVVEFEFYPILTKSFQKLTDAYLVRSEIEARTEEGFAEQLLMMEKVGKFSKEVTLIHVTPYMLIRPLLTGPALLGLEELEMNKFYVSRYNKPDLSLLMTFIKISL
jgi:hypothetical protein